jgi:hypothetical protein
VVIEMVLQYHLSCFLEFLERFTMTHMDKACKVVLHALCGIWDAPTENVLHSWGPPKLDLLVRQYPSIAAVGKHITTTTQQHNIWSIAIGNDDETATWQWLGGHNSTHFSLFS